MQDEVNEIQPALGDLDPLMSVVGRYCCNRMRRNA
jgi:hypothetical protein